MPPHGSRPRPVDPGGQLPAAAAARRAPAPRLQPPLGVASADARPVRPDRPARPGAATATRSRSSAARPTGPRLLDDANFLAEYHDVLADFDAYMANGSDHWFQRNYADALRGPIAYFCAEYGLHESLGIYSGGLGVLAGDHMKSASDMALPASASACSTARATSARRSTPTATRSTTTPTTTWPAAARPGPGRDRACR